MLEQQLIRISQVVKHIIQVKASILIIQIPIERLTVDTTIYAFVVPDDPLPKVGTVSALIFGLVEPKVVTASVSADVATFDVLP